MRSGVAVLILKGRDLLSHLVLVSGAVTILRELSYIVVADGVNSKLIGTDGVKAGLCTRHATTLDYEPRLSTSARKKIIGGVLIL